MRRNCIIVAGLVVEILGVFSVGLTGGSSQGLIFSALIVMAGIGLVIFGGLSKGGKNDKVHTGR